jgi:7-cyano-7-deazaguanine synthase in queuosine biosynthesis
MKISKIPMEGDYDLTAKLKYESIAGHIIGIYNDGPVGVSISGGADSALLLYIIMKYTSAPIHIYSMICDEVQPAMEPAVDRVVAACSKLTQNANFTLHKINLEIDSINIYFDICNTALNSGEINIMYNALTSFPTKEEYAEWPPGSEFYFMTEFRDESIEHPLFGLEIPKHAGGVDRRFYRPWMNKNKKDIAAMYKELDIEAAIYPITRSCEEYASLDKQCGKCWWCRERIWAFGYLDQS